MGSLNIDPAQPRGLITELYIFVARDAAGNESICSVADPNLGVVMLLGGAPDAMDQMREIARGMLSEQFTSIRLQRFVQTETTETLTADLT